MKTTIFHSEVEFRHYVIHHLRDIRQIIVFEDVLDCVIYFYCFTYDNAILATKELNNRDLHGFIQEYTELLSQNHMKITYKPNAAFFSIV